MCTHSRRGLESLNTPTQHQTQFAYPRLFEPCQERPSIVATLATALEQSHLNYPKITRAPPASKRFYVHNKNLSDACIAFAGRGAHCRRRLSYQQARRICLWQENSVNIWLKSGDQESGHKKTLTGTLSHFNFKELAIFLVIRLATQKCSNPSVFPPQYE